MKIFECCKMVVDFTKLPGSTCDDYDRIVIEHYGADTYDDAKYEDHPDMGDPTTVWGSAYALSRLKADIEAGTVYGAGLSIKYFADLYNQSLTFANGSTMAVGQQTPATPNGGPGAASHPFDAFCPCSYCMATYAAKAHSMNTPPPLGADASHGPWNYFSALGLGLYCSSCGTHENSAIAKVPCAVQTAPANVYATVGSLFKATYAPGLIADDLKMFDSLVGTPTKVPVCECGGKKMGAADFKPGHSDWCDVAEGKS